MFLLRQSYIGSDDKSGHKKMFLWVATPLAAALVALAGSSRAQSLLDVSLKFLQRHGVPCQTVVKVGTLNSVDEVATCQDGRQWVLLWLENEIAFVNPSSQDLYRWHREAHALYPHLYCDRKTDL